MPKSTGADFTNSKYSLVEFAALTLPLLLKSTNISIFSIGIYPVGTAVSDSVYFTVFPAYTFPIVVTVFAAIDAFVPSLVTILNAAFNFLLLS